MTVLDRRTAIVAGLGALACAGGSRAAEAAGDMALGDPKAKVKVVEYASVTCSHCATFNAEVFPAFKAKYVDTGKVHYTLKEFLTAPPGLAAIGFLVARCAGPNRYFQVVDAIMRSQPQWRGDVRPIFLKIAADAGLSEAQFDACLKDEAAIAALNERVRKAVEEDKVTATPTFFVNGRKVAEGAMSLAELDAAIAAARK